MVPVVRLFVLLLASTLAASAASHVYWRVFFPAPANSAAMEEFQMYDASGSYLPAGGTATSSTSFGASFTAAKAFDSDFTTFWIPSSSPPDASLEWVTYQFPSAVDVATVRIVDREGGFGAGPDHLKIQSSNDGITWTDATAVFTPDPGGISNTVHPNIGWSFAVTTPASGFYLNWRVRPTAPSQTAAGHVRCAELSLRATAGGSNLADDTRQYGLGSGNIANVYDGNPATFAEIIAPGDATAFGLNWLGYAFPTPVRLRQVCWTMPSSGGTFATSGPTSMAVEGSNDGGSTWTTAWTGSFATWTADGQTQCLTQIVTLATVRVD